MLSVYCVMPQLDKFSYFSQFFWLCLFFFSFYILICNGGNGFVGISRILKLRNGLLLRFLPNIFSVDFVSYVMVMVVMVMCFNSGEALANSTNDSLVVHEWINHIRNQPALPIPWSPEPFVPEIPVLDSPLFEDAVRRTQLYYRLGPHAVVNNLDLATIVDLVYQQAAVEKHLEAALIRDGISSIDLVAELNSVRCFSFYPHGAPGSAKTLSRYLRQITELGTRQSTPYRRIIRAIRDYELLQAYFLRVRNRNNNQ